jgi:hypothetical protein
MVSLIPDTPADPAQCSVAHSACSLDIINPQVTTVLRPRVSLQWPQAITVLRPRINLQWRLPIQFQLALLSLLL